MTTQLVVSEDALETWQRCGGYYSCPKDSQGNRLGPLMGYAGKYDAPDGTKKQYVGDVYWNFARVEQYPEALDDFAYVISRKVGMGNRFPEFWKPTLVLGAPMGGILLASALGRKLGIRTIFAEKKVFSVATEEKREESELHVDRHEIRPKDIVLIVEDVCNNFSTTDKLVELIVKNGGMAVGIACALNSSKETHYQKGVPVVSRIHRPTEQWKQNDPAVAEDVAKGNVVWKPKEEWTRLAAAMERHSG